MGAPAPATLAAALEQRTVELVQQAPDLDRATLAAAARDALHAGALLAGELAQLALAIERVIDDVAEGDIALGVGLPALAMAAYSLHHAIAAGAAHDPLAVRGSIYELETMTPVPSTGRRPTIDEPRPDVPLEKLTAKMSAPVRRPDHAAPARARRLAALAEELDEPALAALGEARARYERSP